METTVCGGTKVEDKEFVILTELLMVQLLKLDSIAADGEAKVQRKIEVSDRKLLLLCKSAISDNFFSRWSNQFDFLFMKVSLNDSNFSLTKLTSD